MCGVFRDIQEILLPETSLKILHISTFVNLDEAILVQQPEMYKLIITCIVILIVYNEKVFVAAMLMISTNC